MTGVLHDAIYSFLSTKQIRRASDKEYVAFSRGIFSYLNLTGTGKEKMLMGECWCSKWHTGMADGGREQQGERGEEIIWHVWEGMVKQRVTERKDREKWEQKSIRTKGVKGCWGKKLLKLGLCSTQCPQCEGVCSKNDTMMHLASSVKAIFHFKMEALEVVTGCAVISMSMWDGKDNLSSVPLLHYHHYIIC